MRFSTWTAALGAAALIVSGGCANSGEDPTNSRRGRSPADDTRVDRPDGGADRRSKPAAGAMKHTLAFPTGDRETSVVMLEVDSPDEVRLGQSFQQTLRVTNLTDTPLENVQVRNAAVGAAGATTQRAGANGDNAGAASARPENAGGVMATPAAGDSATPVWNVGTLKPKESRTYNVSDVADAEGAMSSCLTVAYAPTLCVGVRVVKPELQLAKAGPSSVLICQPIEYTYTVTNTGTGTVRNVVVEDTLPEGLATADNNRAVRFTVDSLGAGERKQQAVAVKATRTGQFGSRAVARGQGVEAQSREVATQVREAALAVNVEAPESRYSSEAVDYRVTVRNTSDVPAERTVVKLSGAGIERLADRDLGTIPAGESRSFAVSTRAGRQAGTLTLNANATAVCAKPATASAGVNILTVPALQLECIDGSDPVRVGANTTYTITARNEGTGPDKNIALTAKLPPELQFVRSAQGGASAVTAKGQDLTFGPIAELAPGASVTWTIEVKALKAGDVRFYTALNSDSLGEAANETEPTRIIE
jgi:uncharacterized repeat protein (TIGR01451 family)